MQFTSTLKTLAASAALVLSTSAAYAADYVDPSGDGASQSNCYLESVTTSGTNEDLEFTFAGKNGVNYELCELDSIRVSPDMNFSINFKAKKTNSVTTAAPNPQDLRYCVAYIFTDWDCDGTFEQEIPTAEKYSTAYNCYGFFASESSFDGNIKANYDYVLDFTHNFTVPADAKLEGSRIRVIFTEAWDGNAKSSMNGNYQSINKGYSYDFLVSCAKAAAIGEIAVEESNAPVEYFNMQGMRVDADNLNSGLYIRRQGNKAVKVLINK